MFLYMGHYLTLPPAPFHLQSYTDSTLTRLLEVWPRGFGKSITRSVGYPLWVLLCDPYKTKSKWQQEDIIQISNTAALIEKWIRAQQRELTQNSRILSDFEPQQGEPWRTDEYVLKNSGRVLGKGAGGQIRGEHPTELIIDDLENREEAESEIPRQKMSEYFFQDLWGTLRHKVNPTRVKIVGTFVHPLALLPRLYALDWWEKRKYAVYKDDQSPLWPEYMDDDALTRLRQQVPETAWASEYMNEPLVSENPVFRRNQFRYYTDDGMFSSGGKRVDIGNLYVITAIDPAISQRDGSDWSAIVTIGIAWDDTLPLVFVLDVRRGHWGIKKQINELLAVYEKYPSSTQLIESIAYQKALFYEYKDHCDREGLSNHVIEIIPDKDKGIRANRVRHFFDRCQVFFNKDDKMHRVLGDELALFDYSVRRHGNDDCVDALVYCLDHADTWIRRRKVNSTAHKKPNIVGVQPDGWVYGIRKVAND